MDSYILKLQNDFFDINDPLMSLVSYERKEKIKKLHFNIDKKLSLYSELVSILGITRILNVDPRNLLFDTYIYGKPYLKNFNNIFFSISHTRNAILCCISEKSEIGADIEKITDFKNDILESIGHPNEIEHIHSLSDSKKAIAFYKIWTRKEAFGKYNGLGICQNLKNIDTFSSAFINLFHTWISSEYVCSVYCNTDINHKYYIDENNIRQYYINLLSK